MEFMNQPDYVGRIHRLREAVNRGWLLLYRGGEYFNENLYYLTGLDSFYTVAFISMETDEAYLLVHPIEYEAVMASCPVHNVAPCVSHDLPQKLTDLISHHSVEMLYTDYAFSSRTPLPAEWVDLIRSACPQTHIRALPEQLLKMRAIKDVHEIATIKKGRAIIDKIFLSLPNLIRPGINEAEIAAKIYGQLIAGGFNRFYDIFIASGKNAASPFYRANSDIIPENSVILIDICAAIDNYVCDMTRTFPTSGQFRQRDEELYSIVADVHRKAVKSVCPGNTLADISEKAKDHFAAYGLDRYYLNKIGHFLGLSPDDPGYERTSLEKGMVLTIEPGLYMPIEDRGIRIEDVIIIE
jgi:Xaa-Pro aminopeptidase